MPFERIRQVRPRTNSQTLTAAAQVTQPQAMAEIPQSGHHFGSIPIELPAPTVSAPVQAKSTMGDQSSVPNAQPSNLTGLPDHLKAGVENLSGFSLEKVRVHYNSDKPTKLQALAYTQGTDIHVAPGQEQHLAHEAWHVVQQAQGRVRPTMQLKGGVPVNEDRDLEHEADVMGTLAPEHRSRPHDSGCACPSCRPIKMADEASASAMRIPIKAHSFVEARPGNLVQRMCDHGHPYHPNGRCPDIEYGYQSGLPLGPKSSISSPPASRGSATFSAVEQAALDAKELEYKAKKTFGYAGLNPREMSLPTGGETERLIPKSDALKKEQVKGIKEGVAKKVVSTIADKASGHSVSSVATAGSAVMTAASAGAPTSTKESEGYERIKSHPIVEKSYEVFPRLFGKQLVNQAAGTAGNLAGGALGTMMMPGAGTIAGGMAGGTAGRKLASKVTGAESDREEAEYLIKQLHLLALNGDAEAFAQLKSLGLEDETIMASDGWKAAIEKLP